MPEFIFTFRHEDAAQIALVRKAIRNVPGVEIGTQATSFFTISTESPTGHTDFLTEYYRLADAAHAKN